MGPSDLHPVVEDFFLGGACPVVIADLVDALILRQRTETVIPLHAAGPVGLQRFVSAMEVLAEAQAALDRL